jgi:hypothetical protein
MRSTAEQSAYAILSYPHRKSHPHRLRSQVVYCAVIVCVFRVNTATSGNFFKKLINRAAGCLVGKDSETRRVIIEGMLHIRVNSITSHT